MMAVTIDLKGPSAFCSSAGGRGNVFALAYGDRDFRICEDKQKYNITRDGIKYDLCEWVAQDPIERCQIDIIKYKRINKKGKKSKSSKRNAKRIRRMRVNPQKYCGCTCVEPTKISCPSSTIDPIIDFHQSPCTGYPRGKICSYEHIWTGCTYENLRCTPISECTCGLFSRPAEASIPDDWFCVHYDYAFEICDPNVTVPLERWTPCEESEMPPTPPIII